MSRFIKDSHANYKLKYEIVMTALKSKIHVHLRAFD